MSATNPKSKMISFRISGREYEILKALHPQQGARNLSDFARTAMLRHLKDDSSAVSQPSATGDSDNASLSALNARIDSLQGDVQRLLQLLTPPAPGSDSSFAARASS